MSRIIYCEKLKKKCEGLDEPPVHGKLGERIFNSISVESWNEWLTKQTMIINEERLNLLYEDDRCRLLDEADKYLFGEMDVGSSCNKT